MGFLDKMKDVLSKNSDKVETAIDKVGDAVDKKTGNKYQGIVDKAQDAAKKAAAGSEAQPPHTPSSGSPAEHASDGPADLLSHGQAVRLGRRPPTA